MSDSPSAAPVMAPAPIPFIDLQAQRRRIADRIDRAIARVLEHGMFIMGPEVAQLERQMAEFVGVRHAVSCGSGTEALLMPLMVRGIGGGDAVFVPSFTFAATAEVVALVGATPVFVDVLPETFNMDPASLEAAIKEVSRGGLRPAAVIPVDLFGLAADYEALNTLARRHNLLVIEDAAQSYGGTYRGRRAGSLAEVAATSFFPSKPLACYGDGGAIFTDDADFAAGLRSVRVHGQGTDKYDNVVVGLNGRLDTLQAAILLEKHLLLEDELVRRQEVAARYSAALSGLVEVPRVPEGYESAWAQYTILVDQRDRVAAALKASGIPTAIYYPKPLHLQQAYAACPQPASGLAVSTRFAGRVLSLPMHPYLDEATQDRIVEVLTAALR
jgi:UDP-2-acetamido-2-deoxy-ribo-hexuluronate aminotransferase